VVYARRLCRTLHKCGHPYKTNPVLTFGLFGSKEMMSVAGNSSTETGISSLVTSVERSAAILDFIGDGMCCQFTWLRASFYNGAVGWCLRRIAGG
jgi:hypothetical protein